MLKHLYGNTLTVLLLRPVTKESTPSPQSLFPRDCTLAAATYTEALPMCDKASLNIDFFLFEWIVVVTDGVYLFLLFGCGFGHAILTP